MDATMATETLLQSEMAGIVAAAAEAVTLAKAAVKAARDVVALSEGQALPTNDDYLKDFPSEADLLRLGRARLTEMERLEVTKPLHDVNSKNDLQEACESHFPSVPNSTYALEMDWNLLLGNAADSTYPLQEIHNVTVRSRRQMERRARRARTSDKAVNVAPKRVRKGKKFVPSVSHNSDPLTVLLNSTSSRLLTAEEEVLLSQGIQDLMKLDGIRESYKDNMGREPTLAQWAEVVGVDQKTLKRRLQVGRDSKSKMIRSNLRLVISVAKKYENRGMSLKDLIQVGSRGLVRGAEKFDCSRGFKFSTYAHWWIRQAITKAIPEHSRIIRLPIHVYVSISRIREATRLLYQEHEREPTSEEIAEVAGMSVKKMRKVIRSSKLPTSIDRHIGQDGQTKLSEIIEDPDAESVEAIACQQLMKEDLHKVLKSLTAQEYQVLRLRYGLDDGRMKTLQEIGEYLHLSRERIRQIVVKALRKLKKNHRSKNLKHYLEV